MTNELSERQGYWFEHLQRASEQQVSLARYAREQGLAVQQLYGAKTWLVKIGVWPGGTQRAGLPSSEFVAVRMLPGSHAVRCRLSHVSGWSVECEGWPDAAWLRSVVGGHAAA